MTDQNRSIIIPAVTTEPLNLQEILDLLSQTERDCTRALHNYLEEEANRGDSPAGSE
jgi:hypothetical protein